MPGPDVSRKCAGCEEEGQKKETLQMTSAAAPPALAEGEPPGVVQNALQSPGQQLDAAARVYFEPRFGHDFSDVRVHTDNDAAESAQSIGASAYTVGPHIAFATGQYAPATSSGLRLLAHELTHVIQQAEGIGTGTPSASTTLQRSKASEECGGGTCASPADSCLGPDPGKAGSDIASSRWELELNVDIEARDWEAALRSQQFGHAYVRFWESSGREYTYGFYPAGTLPDENNRTVPGCVHHPDTTHDNCIDDTVGYTLTSDQYQRGLKKAQDFCSTPGTYGQNYTCATFASDVVRAAGEAPPSSTSEKTTIYYQPVPRIDNPNTMHEWITAGRESLDTAPKIRSWVAGQSYLTLGALPTSEVIRFINVLLGGWISDDDAAAVERVCTAVTSTSELVRISTSVKGTIDDMNSEQQQRRVKTALKLP